MCLGAAAYSLRLQERDHSPLDGRVVAVIALAGMFGFFAFGMTLTSGKYILENITNVDVLNKSRQYYLAVRVPLDSPSTPEYWTITFPLPWHDEPNGQPPEPRDSYARRTFAILRTEKGENPWDLGVWRNFKSVMGNNIFKWLLPIKHSPCCNHDSAEGEYEFGPLVDELKRRYRVPGFKEDTPAMNGIELQQRTHTGR